VHCLPLNSGIGQKDLSKRKGENVLINHSQNDAKYKKKTMNLPRPREPKKQQQGTRKKTLMSLQKDVKRLLSPQGIKEGKNPGKCAQREIEIVRENASLRSENQMGKGEPG